MDTAQETRLQHVEVAVASQGASLGRIEGKLEGIGDKLGNIGDGIKTIFSKVDAGTAALEAHKAEDQVMAQTVAVLKSEADKREARRGVTVAAWLTGAVGIVASLALHLLKALK